MRKRFRHAVQLYPVTAGALVALTVAALALVLVLDEQSDGRKRDKRLEQADVRIGDAFRALQQSRRESVRISCRTNQRQNNVLLAIIEFSIQRARAEGRSPTPEVLAKTNKLLRPITPEGTKRVCAALLRRVDEGPPPPGLPKQNGDKR